MRGSRDLRLDAVEAVATALDSLDRTGREWVLKCVQTAQALGAAQGEPASAEVVSFAENLLRAERGEL